MHDKAGKQAQASQQAVRPAQAKARPEAPSFATKGGILQLQRAIGNRAVVQMLAIVKKGARYQEAKSGDSPETITETRGMSKAEREQLVAELSSGQGKNEKLLNLVQQDWVAYEKGNQVASLEDLYALGAQIEALEQKQQQKEGLGKDDENAVNSLAEKLLNASDANREASKQGEDKKKEGYLYQQIISSLLERLTRIDGGKGLRNALSFRGLDQEIAVEDRDAYRDDIPLMGTWGGLAEADLGARALNFRCEIFALRNGNYQRVIQVGTGNQAAYNLLHLGNHYVVVQNAADGQQHDDAHNVVETEKDGNCLYEALLLIRDNGVKLAAGARRLQIKALRDQVATGITDEQIDASILEMRLSNQTQGIGINMQVRLASPEWVAKRLEGLSVLEEFDLVAVNEAAESYLAARKADSSSEATLKAIKEFGKAYQAARQLAASVKKAQSEGESSGESLRKQALAGLGSDATHKPSSFNEQQTIITVKGEDFVLDSLGQLVRRHVVRNISIYNEQELKEHGSIYPSSESPYEDAKKAQPASGTGKNKIKKPSAEMVHVQGTKPSPFLSATTLETGALNPQGKKFMNKIKGKSKEATTVSIDLAHIAPADIKALYSDEGIAQYLLDGLDGGESAQQSVLTSLHEDEQTNAGKDKRAEGLAKSNTALSEKEWQAVLDVVRTKEVLISCEIPEEAVTKQ